MAARNSLAEHDRRAALRRCRGKGSEGGGNEEVGEVELRLRRVDWESFSKLTWYMYIVHIGRNYYYSFLTNYSFLNRKELPTIPSY